MENPLSDSDDSVVCIYDNIKPEGDIVCSPCGVSDMSTTDSDSGSISDCMMHVRVDQSDIARVCISRNAIRKAEVLEMFSELTSNYGDIFPLSMETVVSKKLRKQIQAIFGRNSFVYAAKSLYVTLNLESNRLRIPRSLLFDLCIFSQKYPPAILSFVTHSKREKGELYNTLLARGVTVMLRRFVPENISVINGIVEENSDLDKRWIDIERESAQYALMESLRMDKDKSEAALMAFLTTIAVSGAYPLLRNVETGDQNIWLLNKAEFDFLTRAIDGIENDQTHRLSSDSLFVKLELGVRTSKRGKTLLLLQKTDLDRIDVNALRVAYPKLEVRDERFCESFASYPTVISSTATRDRNTPTSKRTTWLISSSDSDAMTRKTRKARKRKQKRSSTREENVGDKAVAFGAPKFKALSPTMLSIAVELFRGSIKVINISAKSFSVEFIMYLLLFLILYDKESPSSILFCILKCLPVLYLIICVMDQCGKDTKKKQYMVLLSGLILSVIGEVLLVWKYGFNTFGIISAALGHLFYAQFFGWKLFQTFFCLSFLTIAINFIIQQGVDNSAYEIGIYILSVSLLGWGAMSKAYTCFRHEMYVSTYLRVLGLVSFVISSVINGMEWFISPFECAQFFSMMFYYMGQLCVTHSVLDDTAIVQEFKFMRYVYFVIIGGLLEKYLLSALEDIPIQMYTAHVYKIQNEYKMLVIPIIFMIILISKLSKKLQKT